MPTTRILIVENDRVRGGVLKFLLGEIGSYTTTHVSTTSEALKAVAHETFDLVLTNTLIEEPADGIAMA